jgi:hypothetical protein
MEKVYADLIMKGRKKLSDVPDNLKQEVIEILTEHGWVGDD